MGVIVCMLMRISAGEVGSHRCSGGHCCRSQEVAPRGAHRSFPVLLARIDQAKWESPPGDCNILVSTVRGVNRVS